MRTISVITLLTLLNVFWGKSQNPLTHTEKVFVDDEGQIFWNKNLPVYISLSTNPDGDSGYLMKSKTTPQYTEPYYFDTEGPNYMRTRWAVDKETGLTIEPKIEVLWDVYADSRPPLTNVKYSYGGHKVLNGKHFYSADVTAHLTASDKVSGVESIYYSLNGEPFKEYESGIKPVTEKEWTLVFYAVDKVGNSEADSDDWKRRMDENGQNFSVDATPPITSISIQDPKFENTLSPKTMITLESQDGGAGVNRIYYSLNGEQPKIFSQKLALSNLPEGGHELEFYSEDNVANQEETKAYSFYLDKTPPSLDFIIGEDQFVASNNLYVSERSTISILGSDEKAGLKSIHYSLDQSEYVEFTSPISCNLKPGIHKISYYGLDKVDNKGSVSKIFRVDNNPPQISYQIKGPQHNHRDTIFVRDITTFNIVANEKGYNQSGVKSILYEIDGENETEFSQDFSLLEDGHNHLKIKAIDNVNNESVQGIMTYVDNTPPEMFHHFSVDPIGNKVIMENKMDIYPSEVQLYLAATDKEVGNKEIYYSINGNSESKYTKPIQYFRSGSNFEIKIRALDLLGNEGTSTVTFSVEEYYAKTAIDGIASGENRKE